MSSGYDKPGRLRWSLLLSGLGTAINANGNSGPWQGANPNSPTSMNQQSSIDLRDVEDGWLTAYVTGQTGTTPTLTVTLNRFDNQGNAWTVISLPAVNATGPANGKQVDFGKHGGSTGNFVVLPAWGQVSWVVGGTTPSFTGVEIELWVR